MRNFTNRKLRAEKVKVDIYIYIYIVDLHYEIGEYIYSGYTTFNTKTLKMKNRLTRNDRAVRTVYHAI